MSTITSTKKRFNTAVVHHPPTDSKDRRNGEVRRIVHEKCTVLLYTEETLSTGSEPMQANAMDISARGLGVLSESPIAAETNLILNLRSTQFSHELRAKVVWCKSLPSIGRIIKRSPAMIWRLGLEFAPRTPEEAKLIESIASAL